MIIAAELSDQSQRRLREASKYVSRSWIPASSTVHKRVQEKINKKLPREEILEEIRTDFGLFSHYLRNLKSSSEDASRLNPAMLLHSLTDPDFRNIFPAKTSDVSMHDLLSAKEIQLSRVRHAVISCSTVELLAERVYGDSTLACVSSSLLQLGHLLVAWNYPGSCMRAAANREISGLSFDGELEKLLGFTTQQLGVYVAALWSKEPTFLATLGMIQVSEIENEDRRKEIADLRRFCEIGEMLSRINDAGNYPGSLSAWRECEQDLVHYLGAKGTMLIRDRIEHRFPHYVSLAPNLFPSDLSPERAQKTANHLHSKKLLEQNVYIKRCTERVRPVFEKVYSRLYQGELSSEALSILIHEAIPACGFQGGCLYFLDPNRMVMVPRLKIGDAKNQEFKPVSCSCGGERSHPVSEAFHTTLPLQGEGVIVNGDVISHVTGKFGRTDKEGILFLQYDNAVPSIELAAHRLMYFKAIRQSLIDALAL